MPRATHASVFDAVAADYDRAFTHTPLARVLRDAVWARLAEVVRPGVRVLEIGCGTGEDAVWAARRGAQVLATDVSPAMLDVTRTKAERAGMADKVETRLVDAEAPLLRAAGDGAGVRADVGFSNFGALNCVSDLHPIAGALAQWVRPGGSLVLVFINRWCAWEIAWHLLHLQPRAAIRRLLRGGVDARVGGGIVHIRYPSIGAMRRAFSPSFRLKRVTGLGVFLPPSYLEPVVAQRPRLFAVLKRWEETLASQFGFRSLADHVILELDRS